MAQKPIGGNDVIFWNSIFRISNCRTTKQMTFLESWDKTQQNAYFLKENFDFQDLTIFDLNLTWPSVKCEN